MMYSETILTIIGLYTLFVIYLIVNWLRLKKPALKKPTTEPLFSVVVPFRNEKENLPRLVELLLGQKENQLLVEMLLVDDHSDDGGAETIRSRYSDNEKVKLLSLAETEGKKSAIKKASEVARGRFLITLDADVEIDKNWLSTIARFCVITRPAMVLLPVMFTAERSLFHKLQTVEFLSLMGTTAATAAAGKPILANGAGMVIKKSVFDEVRGFEGNEKIASGDDVFLLYKVKKLFPADILYLHHPDAITATRPQATFSDFCAQRLRWGGKAKSFTDVFGFSTALLILITHISLVAFFILTLAGELHAELFIFCFLVKSAADFLFLFLVAGFYKKRHLLWLFPLEAILYPIYIVGIGIAGLFVKPKWKGRKV